MNRENNIGLQIKQQRKLLGLTQEQLAEKVGIDNKHLSKIENGLHLPTYKTLKKLSEVLQVDIGAKSNIIKNENIPLEPIFCDVIKIFNSAKTKKEKEYYLEILKLAQKGVNLIHNKKEK